MKKQVLSIAVTASLLVALAVITACAGTSATSVSTIPFGFTAGALTVPAGTYTISETQTPGVLLLSDEQGHRHFISTQGPADSKDPAKAELVFHRYGEQYFLARISYGTQGAYMLGMSRAERETVNGKSNSLAKNEQKPELVHIGVQ